MSIVEPPIYEYLSVSALVDHVRSPGDTNDQALLAEKAEVAVAFVRQYLGVDVPFWQHPPVIEAMKLLVGHLFENREATLVGVNAQLLPLGFYDLLDAYKERVF